ncbi:glycoside hydrolase [Gloeopeniophorella convolvens]|nr:glycoside hydrolase [Gloeopeniophorella convolvens]
MFRASALITFTYLAVAHAQQAGTLTAEVHPTLSWQTCEAGGSCTTNSGTVVLDANWRWLHTTSGYTNCYTGNTWDATICPDPTTCAENCALDGADYSGTYGVTTSDDALTLKFVTQGSQTNVGSRLYLMASDTSYEMFKALNREITFDVDVSQLPCGLNGAVYFSEMAADGGLAAYPNNKAGAKYGTGYCDSQCPKDLKFINGAANVNDWTPDSNSANSGTGEYGSCCSEMDIWEANSVSAAFTPHPCQTTGQTQCSGDQCGGTDDRYGGICDPDGCDFNSFRMGNTTFYGPSMTVDTTKKFTIVTQFLTDDGTDTGTLSEIKRFYVQDGVVIPNSNANIAGVDPDNSITEQFCTEQKAAFGDTNSFENQGGLPTMGDALGRGVVLVLSVWDDYAVNMLWLDSDYPTDADPSSPGVARGTCATTSGVPATVESQNANAQVIYSNIKFGPIGSTFASGSSGTGSGSSSSSASSTAPTSVSSSSTASAPGPTQSQYGQCGGTGYTGPSSCASGTTCKVVNAYYSQCL